MSVYFGKKQACNQLLEAKTEPPMNLLTHVTDEAVLPTPKASEEYEEIRSMTKAVTEVMFN